MTDNAERAAWHRKVAADSYPPNDPHASRTGSLSHLWDYWSHHLRLAEHYERLAAQEAQS